MAGYHAPHRKAKKMRGLLIIIIISTWGLSETSAQVSSVKKQPELLFNSGFEKGSKVVHLSNSLTTDDDIIGLDLSVSEPNNWVKNIDENPGIGNFNIQYQGGDSTMRFARIVPEPGNPENSVLQFWVNQPNVDGKKARIQANIYEGYNQNMDGIKELYQSVRLFIPEEMEIVKNFPDKINWFTILEVWNNIQWIDDPFPFRITVGIGKPTSDKSELHFLVGAEDYEYSKGIIGGRYKEIWYEMNTEIDVPIGNWFTLEYYIKEGKGNSGRFYMSIAPKGGKKQVIFDIQNYMHNTKDLNPDGITLWNPMKLYTSKSLVDYVRRKGTALQIYWDDFEIWENRVPEIQ